MISEEFIERVLTNPVIALAAEFVPDGRSFRGAAIYPQDLAMRSDDPMHAVFKDFNRISMRQRRGGEKPAPWNEYLASIGLGTREAVDRMIESRRCKPPHNKPPIPVAKIYSIKKAEDPNDPLHEFYLGYQREKWNRRASGIKMTPWSEYLIAHGIKNQREAEAYVRRWSA